MEAPRVITRQQNISCRAKPPICELENAAKMHLSKYFRRLDFWRSPVPTLAVCGLHRVHGLHFQLVHPFFRPVLVHHVALEVPEEKDQEAGPHHDSFGLDRGCHVGGASVGVAPHRI